MLFTRYKFCYTVNQEWKLEFDAWLVLPENRTVPRRSFSVLWDKKLPEMLSYDYSPLHSSKTLVIFFWDILREWILYFGNAKTKIFVTSPLVVNIKNLSSCEYQMPRNIITRNPFSSEAYAAIPVSLLLCLPQVCQKLSDWFGNKQILIFIWFYKYIKYATRLKCSESNWYRV